MKLRAASLALVAALGAGGRGASAQDTHYWAIQYGPVGQLVGGQLIGGVSDLSATYYNPGALALENESSYLLSTESVQWESVGTDSSAGIQVLDTSSSRFGAAPSLLAGVLPRWFGQRTRLAWSFLTRQQFDVRLGQRLTDPLGPGVRSAAESYFDQDAVEDWGGLTFSRQLSDSVGIGLTWYGVYRGQRSRKELSLQSVAPDGSSLAASGVSDFEYTHYRTLAKLGLAWRNRDWKAGLSITTPSLGVFGSGKAAYTLSLTGTDKDRDGRPDPPVLVTDTQDGLDSQYRSSWAVGAGVSRRFGGTTLYASAEWYAAVSRFAVIEVPTSAPEAGGLTQALASVLNAGVGVEHVLSGGVSVYGAFNTDSSAATGSPSENVTISDWDIYHVSGGLAFRFRDNRFTLGASWARGHKQRPLDSPIPPDALPGTGIGQDVAIRYSKVTILFGFVFGS
jgi:hypothetical protein